MFEVELACWQENCWFGTGAWSSSLYIFGRVGMEWNVYCVNVDLNTNLEQHGSNTANCMCMCYGE